DQERLTAEYLSLLWRSEGFHRWLDAASGREFEARIGSVAPDGMLTLVDPENNQHVYAFKEVAAVL
ncbi:MAG: biotin--[acetyl-CoA-carboxylase] ligase, partial [Duncaniella sp.]|nr:biotin--[acetyl-CoA-carboxylase] ligase [Duncaniella sp.]